jgi:AcrR family transcriptional regulator
MVELVRERGVGGVTVAHIVGRSGVSRRTFYELFEDREACFLAAFDRAVQQVAERVLAAYGAAGGVWRERMRAGLGALLGFIDEEPAVGGLCVVDALAGGPRVLERRARIVGVLVDAVHEGRLAARSGRAPRRLVAEGVVGAVLSVIHGRLSAREQEALVKLLNPLMAMVVLPYLGSAAAERELAHQVPRARRRVRSRPVDPLRDLDMRLTYRTVRVLLAVAEQPAASSREVADASGVADQGQMSKLLWRLENLGLISNDAPRPGRGEPNAWTLTTRGHEVEQAIRTQTTH